jgi:hypothetical protein
MLQITTFVLVWKKHTFKKYSRLRILKLGLGITEVYDSRVFCL